MHCGSVHSSALVSAIHWTRAAWNRQVSNQPGAFSNLLTLKMKTFGFPTNASQFLNISTTSWSVIQCPSLPYKRPLSSPWLNTATPKQSTGPLLSRQVFTEDNRNTLQGVGKFKNNTETVSNLCPIHPSGRRRVHEMGFNEIFNLHACGWTLSMNQCPTYSMLLALVMHRTRYEPTNQSNCSLL